MPNGPNDDINVDLSQSPIRALPTKDVPSKEGSARSIAIYIVMTFAGTLGLLIVLGFTLLIWLRWAPDKADLIFSKAVIPFTEKIATFATTVFGPLLAFILGYYFGEKSQGSQPNATKQNSSSE